MGLRTLSIQCPGSQIRGVLSRRARPLIFCAHGDKHPEGRAIKRLRWRWVRRSPTASNYKTGRRVSIEPHRRQRKSCDIPLNPRGFLKKPTFRRPLQAVAAGWPQNTFRESGRFPTELGTDTFLTKATRDLADRLSKSVFIFNKAHTQESFASRPKT